MSARDLAGLRFHHESPIAEHLPGIWHPCRPLPVLEFYDLF